MENNKIILVLGAGSTTGSAVAKRFAKEGYIICAVRRNVEKLSLLKQTIEDMGGICYTFGLDARKEDDMIQLISNIEKNIGPIEVALHNIGPSAHSKVIDTSADVYFESLEMTSFSAFLMGREVAKVMIPRKKGTILFTGATASIRGSAGYSAFAGAMHSKRSFSQSLAKELSPLGIHVAHLIIDGVIDSEFVKTKYPHMYQERKPKLGLLNPDHIADTYWTIHQQPRDAWSYELDLRPWVENW